MLGYAIRPKTKADEDKLSVGIRNMMQEDGTIRLENNAETHEQVLYGLGDQHIDLIVSKLKSKYKVEVTTKEPTVQYRETIRGTAPHRVNTRSRTAAPASMVTFMSASNHVTANVWNSPKKLSAVPYRSSTSRR